jgi:hypothetical protein
LTGERVPLHEPVEQPEQLVHVGHVQAAGGGLSDSCSV